MNNKYKITKDKYRVARGGHSTIYTIKCFKCGDDLFIYQKDGTPHQWLKRLYKDRILEWFTKCPEIGKPIVCKGCENKIAPFRIYEKEDRIAFEVVKERIKRKILYREWYSKK